jgi:Fe2+ transport system protein FeoA
MTPLDLDENDVAEIRALRGDAATSRRMHALGLCTGAKIRFVRAAPFSGPVLVEDQTTGARIMIDRAMARQIEVRRDEAKPT